MFGKLVCALYHENNWKIASRFILNFNQICLPIVNDSDVLRYSVTEYGNGKGKK